MYVSAATESDRTVTTRVPFGWYHWPCVPKIALNRDTRTPSVASTVTPLGLGRLNEVDGDFPTVLQEVNVRVIDSQVCNRSPMYQGWIQESMVCAGNNGGGLDACKYAGT